MPSLSQGTLPSIFESLFDTGKSEDSEDKANDNDGKESVDIKGKTSKDGLKRVTRKGAKHKKDGKENKINYFFNSFLPKDGDKKGLEKYIKNQQKIAQKATSRMTSIQRSGSSGYKTKQAYYNPWKS